MVCFVIQTRPSHSLTLPRLPSPLHSHSLPFYPARTHYAYHHAPLHVLFTGKKPEGIHPDTTFEYTARWTHAAPALAVVGGLPILVGLVFTFLPICVAFYKGRTPLAAVSAAASAAAAAGSAAAEEENA